MLSDIAWPRVRVAERLGDAGTTPLFPEESLALGRVADCRRSEFTTARCCARLALAELGMTPSPILVGPRRQPLWPDAVVGSITHCPGYRAAAVARHADFASLGIDAEIDECLPVGVAAKVIAPEERRALLELAGGHVHWDRVLFSAKESIYKAWFPIAGCWLGFEDVCISIDPDRRSFHARLVRELPRAPVRRLENFSGRFGTENGFVFTFVAVTREE